MADVVFGGALFNHPRANVVWPAGPAGDVSSLLGCTVAVPCEARSCLWRADCITSMSAFDTIHHATGGPVLVYFDRFMILSVPGGPSFGGGPLLTEEEVVALVAAREEEEEQKEE